MIVCAVPVKDLVNAKQRLIKALAPDERMALARAMLRDVLRALGGAKLDAVWVVTRDVEVSGIARALGAKVLGEPENRGHTAAVALAQQHAAKADARVFLTIPGDVPLVTAEEIRALVAAACPPAAAVFTPSRSVDIDSPEDLSVLSAEGTATESGRLLARWNVAARLAAAALRR